MEEIALRQLLDAVRSGATSADEAVAVLRRLPFADLGFATIDHHRALRQAAAEVVYAPGKTVVQCVTIVGELLAHGAGPVLATRADEGQAAALADAHGGAHRTDTGTAAEPRSLLAWRSAAPRPERVVVVTAGTADLPVADECAATLAAHGVTADRLTDVGVAGVHRVLAATDRLLDADIVVVVAGMEGALASLIGGLVAAPVVAVPTSVGYGAGLEGVTALLGMLASCASGLTVVGIDNGFGAASAVLRLLTVVDRSRAAGPIHPSAPTDDDLAVR